MGSISDIGANWPSDVIKQPGGQDIFNTIFFYPTFPFSVQSSKQRFFLDKNVVLR